MTGVYGFADRSIRICSLYDRLHQLCRAFRTDSIPDFEVITDQSDIDFEREESARTDAGEGRAIQAYSDACLETLAVYRRIAEKMPYHDVFLFHGSAVAVDGAAYIFTAKSGTGKSTHSRLWRELLGSRAVMINDDKPLIRVHETGTATVYGTPWDGKHHLSSNTAVPVRAICVLEQAGENNIRPITKEDALPMLIQQAYRPADPTALSKTLILLDRLNVKLYRMGCNMDISAAELSYHTMKEE